MSNFVQQWRVHTAGILMRDSLSWFHRGELLKVISTVHKRYIRMG
jgi:hypothetical protein